MSPEEVVKLIKSCVVSNGDKWYLPKRETSEIGEFCFVWRKPGKELKVVRLFETIFTCYMSSTSARDDFFEQQEFDSDDPIGFSGSWEWLNGR